MNHTVRVGLIGFGTIGTGVAQLLLEPYGSALGREDLHIALVRIADLDITTPRDVDVPKTMLTTDPTRITDAADIDIVVELIGGLEPARSLVLRALNHAKSVVTANKALLAAHGDELFQAAAHRQADLMFEASVAGSIPIIRVLRQSLVADQIQALYAILNGTTNYILTKMTTQERPFDEVLAEAQQKGYAEPDPTLDITGKDAVQKLAILLRVAFGSALKVEDLYHEGIEGIRPQDIAYARQFDSTIKLLAIAKRRGTKIEARVHPAMIPSSTLLANIKNEFNAVELVGKAVGTQVFYGKGAGRMPTAAAVVSDIVDLAERTCDGGPHLSAQMGRQASGLELVPMDEITTEYYCRFMVLDSPGVLAAISRILADERISIASVLQKARAEGSVVPVVMMTHQAQEKAMRRAISRISQLDFVKEPTQIIRVEPLSDIGD